MINLTTAELLTVIAHDFGITPDTAIRHGGQTGDDDGPGERVVAPSDLEAMADEECDREERWRESA